ncbi:hypothetical protein A8H39_01775 [Paraburkholderia fungorum]|uniref:hypothetical protein n=1 Tax=Paraburkholderia fungorum TaxID=134537 RepID=UPI000487ADC1|nr:hypothetical protein [Paraburkholderia fungorum]PNE59900.1 hypothetical protein A8H39_01775 [Paraburkholderia fungorum]
MQQQMLRQVMATVSRNIKSALQPAYRVYHFLMEKFIAANGREVLKTVTDSGVTGYMDASIPAEVIPAWREQIAESRARNRRELSRVLENADSNSGTSPAV